MKIGTRSTTVTESGRPLVLYPPSQIVSRGRRGARGVRVRACAGAQRDFFVVRAVLDAPLNAVCGCLPIAVVDGRVDRLPPNRGQVHVLPQQCIAARRGYELAVRSFASWRSITPRHPPRPRCAASKSPCRMGLPPEGRSRRRASGWCDPSQKGSSSPLRGPST
jgi:hypothetical protein